MSLPVVKEIISVKGFFDERGASNGANDVALQKSFADTVIAMLNSMPMLSASEASQVMAVLKDDPYGETQTKRIRDHIDTVVKNALQARVNGHNKAVKAGKSSNGAKTGSFKQFLKTWWNYLTPEDWEKLDSLKLCYSAKQTTLVERGMAIGCTDANEQTLKWALTVLLMSHYKELPTSRQIYDKLQELKQAWEAEQKPFMHERLHEFPEEPASLPGAIYKEAYAADDQPLKS